MSMSVRLLVLCAAALFGASPALAEEEQAPDCAAFETPKEALARGRTAFEVCRPCHDIGRDAENRMGPHLNDLYGRRAGHSEGYASSMPLVFAGERGLVWNDETLTEYLRDPKKLVPGTEMPLIGVDAEDRLQDLLAFLAAASRGCLDYQARPEPVRHQDG